MIDKRLLLNKDENIENQNVLHINRLPARIAAIPAKKRGVYYQNKYDSEMIRALNGDYKFKYLLEDTYKNFYLPTEDDASWDTIDVPSMWQFRGYGMPEYPNIRYSIPFAPPFVCKDNPVGLYRKKFNISSLKGRYILHFAGVEGAFYVYVNGILAGFSKGSRLPSEFDVTSLVSEGENLLAIKVFTYSDATYLENQDMLLANGIFRDVYLIELEESHLWDYRVRTTYDSISIEAKLDIKGDFKIRLTLDENEVTLPAHSTVTHTFKLTNPRLWCAENPNLYDLYIELLDGDRIVEVHSKRVGIMHTRVEGNKFLVNEHPIYIKGINRHENSAKNGRCLTVDEIRRDLMMIKQNNLNAIRLAHYTNDPATYEIAAELGLYLMDEADLETHGAYIMNGDQGYLSKSPEWLEAYFDRIKRMLELNKNEVAIFIWSTGNEAGVGENLEKCIDYIREFDPTKECTITQDTGNYVHFRKIAYYPMKNTENYSDDGYPVMAIEYAHAMGNSPGTLEDYWDYNYTHEKMLGGFAWEFRNHGFSATDEYGEKYYKFGGDFNDIYHWANFNLDGFCTSDGTPKPTWRELGAVSFAAYTRYEDGKLLIKNTNDFKTLSYLSAKYQVEADGITVKKGDIPLPKIAPHEVYSIPVDTSVENIVSGARYFLSILYYEGEKLVHKKQFPLGILSPKEKFTPTVSNSTVYAENYILTVKRGRVTLKLKRGELLSLSINDEELLGNMKLNFHRAYTDNDGIKGLFPRRMGEWQEALLRYYRFTPHDISVEENESVTTVTAIGRVTADSLYSGFFVKLSYDIYENIVLVTVDAEPYGALPELLPRIGVAFESDKRLRGVRWLGHGPHQNYPDAKMSAPVGIWESDIEKLNFLYDMPQETGNREGTIALTLSDGARALSVVGADSFSFSYHPFSLDNLTDSTHRNELIRDSKNHLYVDYKMRGLGSRSCGPDPEEKYELRPHAFTFSFALCTTDFEEAVRLSRKDFGKISKRLSEDYVYEKPERVRELADCDVI